MMSKSCTVLVILLLRACAGIAVPLVIPAQDPNGDRASRLLFSPSASRITSAKDVPAAFLRAREQQYGLEAGTGKISRSVANTNLSTENGSPNNIVKERAASKGFCHSAALYKCGTVVIQEFALPNKLTPEHKCRVRENFLHCMLKPRKTLCRQQNGEFFLKEESMRNFKKQIVELLWTARGCVIGLEAL